MVLLCFYAKQYFAPGNSHIETNSTICVSERYSVRLAKSSAHHQESLLWYWQGCDPICSLVVNSIFHNKQYRQNLNF